MNIDFKRVFVLLIPIRLRKAKLLVAILDSVGAVVNSYYASFLAWLGKKQYEIRITPQVCFLEKLLNDEFDSGLKRIYISEPPMLETQYIYRATDNRDWYFGQGKFFIDDSRFGYAVDFNINIPFGLIYNSNKMKSIVDKYKLCGKTYKIIQANE